MRLWITAIVIWLIDRLLKVLVMENFVLGESVVVVPKFLHLTYILNPGAAFGLLSGYKWVLIVMPFLVLGAIIYLQKKWVPNQKSIHLALGLISGGALGNLYDRIIMGEVVDYLDFQIWPYIFNFADSMICIGVGLILLMFYLGERHEGKTHGQ